jgi:heparan-alpha-glucosaminide N-acetyltransferase
LLIAVIMVFSGEPPEGGRSWIAVRTLRLVSVAVLIILVAAYRSRSGGWLDLRNWSILGSIGWSYLTASLLYRLTRGRVAGLAAALAGLVAWNVSTRLGIDAVTWVARHVPPLGNGGAASIVIAGILAAKVLLADVSVRRRIVSLSSYAVAMIVVGAALAPRFRVAKIGSTPSWCLFSAAITTLLLLAFHLAVDVKGWQRAVAPFLPAGRQALLVYLLPDIFYAVFGLHWLDVYFGVGAVGLVRAAGFAVLVLGVGALVTRRGVRMQV